MTAKQEKTVELLQEFVKHRSESAFREIVENYQDLVFGTACRQLSGDRHLAQDVVQRVFVDLARKAAKLEQGESLGGWLHCHTCFVCSDLRRSDERRKRRELAVTELAESDTESNPEWEQAEAELDDAINELREPDRVAIISRFFERQPLRAVGELFEVTEDAAQKRVTRAIERLRKQLSLRGISVSVAVLLTGLESPAQSSGIAATTIVTAATEGTSSAALVAGLKPAMIAVLLVTTVVLVSKSDPNDEKSPAPAPMPQVTTKKASGVFAKPRVRHREQTHSTTTTMPFASRRFLTLNVANEETGLAVTSGKAVLNWQLEGDASWNSFEINSKGECQIPVPAGKWTRFRIHTRIDGYGDRLLEWKANDVVPIPDEYTAHLVRAKLIGGQVVDHQGQPVSGATVDVAETVRRNTSWKPDRNGFSRINATTDDQGRWSINRIAPELIDAIGVHAHHPRHLRSDFLEITDEQTREQLFSQSHRFVLAAGVVAKGVIQTTGGKPVVGAKVISGKHRDKDRRETLSDHQGRFHLGPVRQGKGIITVSADGFASKSIVVDHETETPDISITLDQGRLVTLTVKAADGGPLPGAKVWYDQWNRSTWLVPHGTEIAALVPFRSVTDDAGLVVWSNAPHADIELDVIAEGYIRDTVEMAASESARTYQATPELTVRGTITDAVTGQPIPFRLVGGAPMDGENAVNSSHHWSFSGRHGRRFKDGNYRFVYRSQVVGNMKVPRLVLRFEAEGYAPAVSRQIKYSERNVVVNAALEPANEIAVSVLNPDGTPAQHASIALLRQDEKIRLTGRIMSNSDVEEDRRLLSTGTRGTFMLPPDDEIIDVLISAPAGFAHFRPDQLQVSPVANLRAWARIEGVARPKEAIPMKYIRLDGFSRDRRVWFQQVSVDYADSGAFVIPFAPAGSPELSFGGSIHRQTFQISPGITNQVNYLLR